MSCVVLLSRVVPFFIQSGVCVPAGMQLSCRYDDKGRRLHKTEIRLVKKVNEEIAAEKTSQKNTHFIELVTESAAYGAQICTTARTPTRTHLNLAGDESLMNLP